MFDDYKDKHEDFIVEEIGDHFQLWQVDFFRGARLVKFGLYDKWWKAEREARKMQKWADAEAF